MAENTAINEESSIKELSELVTKLRNTKEEALENHIFNQITFKLAHMKFILPVTKVENRVNKDGVQAYLPLVLKNKVSEDKEVNYIGVFLDADNMKTIIPETEIDRFIPIRVNFGRLVNDFGTGQMPIDGIVFDPTGINFPLDIKFFIGLKEVTDKMAEKDKTK